MAIMFLRLEGCDMYQAYTCLKTWEEDIFADGCQPNSGGLAEIAARHIKAETVAGLVAALHDFLGSRPGSETVAACGEPDRIDVEVMETDDGTPATDADLDAWELGVKRLWLAVYSFYFIKTAPANLEAA